MDVDDAVRGPSDRSAWIKVAVLTITEVPGGGILNREAIPPCTVSGMTPGRRMSEDIHRARDHVVVQHRDELVAVLGAGAGFDRWLREAAANASSGGTRKNVNGPSPLALSTRPAALQPRRESSENAGTATAKGIDDVLRLRLRTPS